MRHRLALALALWLLAPLAAVAKDDTVELVNGDKLTGTVVETTAEGVEETAQLVELRAHGCSSVQGFLFAEPMTALEVEAMFRSGEEPAVQNVA